jgi:ketosteroid isomerase-like protein
MKHNDSKKSMTKKRMHEYTETYNSGDFNRVVNEYYAESIIFKTRFLELEGRDAVKGFFTSLQSTFTEKLTFINILLENDIAAVVLDSEITLKTDTPDLGGYGPASKGDVLHGDFAGIYKFRGDKITHVKIYDMGDKTWRC